MLRTGSAVGYFEAKCSRRIASDIIIREYDQEKYRQKKKAFYSANKDVIDAVMIVQLPKKYEAVQRFLDINLFEKWRRLDVGLLPQLCLAFTRIECVLNQTQYYSLAGKIAEMYENDPNVQDKLRIARSMHP